MIIVTHVQRQSAGEELKAEHAIHEGCEELETQSTMQRKTSHRTSPGPTKDTKVHDTNTHAKPHENKAVLHNEDGNICMVYVQGKLPMMPTTSLNTAATRIVIVSQANPLNCL